jgi:CheY-like chemotaxis protein
VCSSDLLALMGTLAAKRGIQLGHNGLQDAVVRADRTRLKQVLLNLLSNAIKYNRDGGSVRIDVRPQGSDLLRILVSDTGHGIPADKLALLFQPFNRLDAEHSEIEGTGIGLIITRRIVEMMGGTVDVESTVGAGSTFWIELPRDALPAASASAAGLPAAHAAAHPVSADYQTVLYIEDNPANIKLVAQILGHVPHIHLLTAHTPELGIELALARRPALILLDINLPGMNGYRVLEIFKTEAGLKGTPVIAITANAMPRDIARGKAAGFVDYLTKPLDIEQLLDTVKRCLADGKAEGKGNRT